MSCISLCLPNLSHVLYFIIFAQSLTCSAFHYICPVPHVLYLIMFAQSLTCSVLHFVCPASHWCPVFHYFKLVVHTCSLYTISSDQHVTYFISPVSDLLKRDTINDYRPHIYADALITSFPPVSDIPECDTMNGHCPQRCIERDGGHSCSCWGDFSKDGLTNGRSCIANCKWKKLQPWSYVCIAML